MGRLKIIPCKRCTGTIFDSIGACVYCYDRSEPWPFKFPKPSIDAIKWAYWRGIDEVV